MMVFFTFLSALLLSGIAEYYSILGLASIFPGAFWPVVAMGATLGLAKLVATSWVYRNWSTAPFALKWYLTSAVVVLMMITSMGIFGYLSKAHIDSTLAAGDNVAELRIIEKQETGTKERLEYLLARAKDPSTASNKLDKQIQETQKELAEINQRKLPLLKENNKLTAEVGPIAYVAQMFFDGDNALDRAVRLVIFAIILVFDPLAVLLLIAGNITLNKQREEEEVQHIYTYENTEPPTQEELTPEEPLQKEVKDDILEVKKENVATMVENKPIVIDGTSGESIPPLDIPIFVKPTKKIEPNYDYDSTFSFRKKDKK